MIVTEAIEVEPTTELTLPFEHVPKGGIASLQVLEQCYMCISYWPHLRPQFNYYDGDGETRSAR